MNQPRWLIKRTGAGIPSYGYNFSNRDAWKPSWPVSEGRRLCWEMRRYWSGRFFRNLVTWSWFSEGRMEQVA